MIYTIIFLSILLIFLSFLLNINVTVYIDTNLNLLKVIIKLYKIKIITINLDLVNLRFSINRSKKTKLLTLFLPKEQAYLLKQIKSSIVDKLYYDKVVLVSNLYIINPEITAHTIGILNTSCNIIKNYFSIKHSDLLILYQNSADFINRKNQIKINIQVYFTIFDMLFAIIMSFYKRGKYVKQKK